VKTKLIGNLGGVHGVLYIEELVSCDLQSNKICAYRQILLVSKDKQHCVPEFILIQHALQLLTSLDYTIAIVAVNDEDDALCILEVMPP
jgi:hypothetical protein